MMTASRPPKVLKVRKALLALAACLLVGGCATSPSLPVGSAAPAAPVAPVAPVAESPDAPSAYRKRVADVMLRMRATCVAQGLKPYFGKTACLSSGITDAMLRDRSKITREQRRAAEQVFSITKDLNAETRRVMTESGTPAEARLAEASKRHDPAIEENQAKLLSGEITWGEYNVRRKALHEQARRELGIGEAAREE